MVFSFVGLCGVAFVPATAGAAVQPEEPLEISGDVDGLYPGSTATLGAVMTNPETFEIRAPTDVDATVGDASRVCRARSSPSRVRPPRSTSPPGRTATIPVLVHMDRAARDACQGSDLRVLVYTGTAVEAPPPSPSAPASLPATGASVVALLVTATTPSASAAARRRLVGWSSTRDEAGAVLRRHRDDRALGGFDRPRLVADVLGPGVGVGGPRRGPPGRPTADRDPRHPASVASTCRGPRAPVARRSPATRCTLRHVGRGAPRVVGAPAPGSHRHVLYGHGRADRRVAVPVVPRQQGWSGMRAR